ncbi:acyl-(acyl-carrier-protein)--UDP-N-acetylglucosamine O-acyltransferase [Desulfocapsa sulfexigens DSM 10523]|uniref:Acyl-[acyl-carrier-protein]--UDP-N-acetylglucosamine O-acyltransferase n=1 Tax=Desulfocapsa sulfexigens (strain DSM 10523 / SB164P1) TaxID=1167006 RepID=M1PEQ1_DESSD|nr:acyl-ACP--UDP-N-acetylglucosamine O-acyltransferase [Desulfocapsa sulfexigens]AGF80022.1 acyl-(acyl-carrier-protein)--UDP-N-acetylglucosamine O-acyltransferase [Desulfocapsa sulfexigens DSM 10523]
MNIHPTAVVSVKAKLHESVIVGPFSVIEDGVIIGAGTTVATHVRISGPCKIGENNIIDSFAALGGAPQDLGYTGEPTELILGNNNHIREYASIHRGTVKGGGRTVIGNNCLIMAYAHIGHDCIIEDYVIIVNAAHLSGHTEVGARATVGGLTGTHQFSRIGTFAFIGGGSAVSKDVPPYAMVTGERGQMHISGLNKVGLRRNGFSREIISRIDAAYRILFHSPELLHNEALDRVEHELGGCEEVDGLLAFIRSSKRGVVKRIKRR